MSDTCADCEKPPQPSPAPSPAQESAAPEQAAPAPAPAPIPTPASSGNTAEGPFIAPDLKQVKPSVVIEFCDRCRWAPRATWIQTELFLTFPTPLLRTITLMPGNTPETGGRFRVWVDNGDGKGDQLAWDRKTEGGFPELKVLKQRIRNIIQPDLGLGHSDVHGKQETK